MGVLHVTDLTEDRGTNLIVIYWVESALALLVVGTRMWGRIMIRKVGLDDYVMLFALVLFLILASFVTYYASIGGCKHLAALSPDEQGKAVKYNWITQPWAIFDFAVAKISVALLILRFIGPITFWRKWILYVAMVSVFLINSVGCILTFAQCNPPRALWEPQLIVEGKAKCWDSKVQIDYAIFVCSWNVMIDVLLAILPVTIFYNLQISAGKKIGLCVLLGLGLVAAVCGAIKTKFLKGMNSWSDLTWETYDLFVWSGSELFVIIVCGSIPPIKPVYEILFTNKRRAHIGYSKSYASAPTNFSSGVTAKTKSWCYSQKTPTQPNASAEMMALTESSRERDMFIREQGNARQEADGIVKTTHIDVYGEAA